MAIFHKNSFWTKTVNFSRKSTKTFFLENFLLINNDFVDIFPKMLHYWIIWKKLIFEQGCHCPVKSNDNWSSYIIKKCIKCMTLYIFAIYMYICSKICISLMNVQHFFLVKFFVLNWYNLMQDTHIYIYIPTHKNINPS